MRCWYKRLAAASPGTIAGPCCPPLSAASRLRRSRFAMAGAGPWHWAQFLARIGATSVLKETLLVVCADATVQTSRAIADHMGRLPNRSVISAPPAVVLCLVYRNLATDG